MTISGRSWSVPDLPDICCSWCIMYCMYMSRDRTWPSGHILYKYTSKSMYILEYRVSGCLHVRSKHILSIRITRRRRVPQASSSLASRQCHNRTLRCENPSRRVPNVSLSPPTNETYTLSFSISLSSFVVFPNQASKMSETSLICEA